MKLNQLYPIYNKLRTAAVWRLLAADNAPIILSILQANLGGTDRRVAASLLFERVERDLEELRGLGCELPQTANQYIAGWLNSGFLERHFPAHATEEEYELSVNAAKAIRLVTGLIEGRSAATESRLAVVIQQLALLAEETDSDPVTRRATLLAERDRIDRELADLDRGYVKTLDESKALERTREIIALSDDLIADFRKVRSNFEELNRDLRISLVDSENVRAPILAALFNGVDLIRESDSGRTFSAFWRLLTDPRQSASLESSLDQLTSRQFWKKCQSAERQFLLQLTRVLLEQGETVHEVMQQLARSLKNFVQSREYLEQRRMSQLLGAAQRAALALKDSVKANVELEYTLSLASCRFKSLSQMRLFDPSTAALDGTVLRAGEATISLESIGELVAQSEIDFTTLKKAIRLCLADETTVSVAKILEQFPAKQGLGSIIGYMALGCKFGFVQQERERVCWGVTAASGDEEEARAAFIPLIYFSKESIHGMV